MRLKTILIIVITLTVIACSNKQVYTAVQDNQRLECGRLPQGQYEQCMKELETPYEEYEQERRVILEGKGK